MLDGVFNHCGWRHPFWQDVRLRGKASRYYNWFCVYDAGELSRLPPEQLSDRRMKVNPPYECFAFAANMPKWNTENPEVIRYLVSIAEQWTREYGIDAWRLDVPDEVSLRFLHAFRTRMRSCNAAVYVIGEIWQDAGWWLEQAVFDGVMDYPLYHAIRDFAMTHTDPLEKPLPTGSGAGMPQRRRRFIRTSGLSAPTMMCPGRFPSAAGTNRISSLPMCWRRCWAAI